MHRILFLSILLLTTSKLIAQDNFVEGTVKLVNGESIETLVNDLFWKSPPDFFEYKTNDDGVKKVYPKDILEIRIGSKAIYRSFMVTYDSTSRKSSELTTNKNPLYKIDHLFLKVLVDSDVALLMTRIKEADHFFIQRGRNVEELVNHPFHIFIQNQELKQENRLYIKQLAEVFASCDKVSLNTKLGYTFEALSKLFQDYAACNGVEAKLFPWKEKSVVKGGLVGTFAQDLMIHDFKGGSGFGAGGFVTIYFPHRVYKHSLYSEIAYRLFGNQSWTGLDYVGFPYQETHQIRSIKTTAILRTRLSKKPTLPYAGYTYAGAGLAASFGLKDLYQRGPYVATKANPFGSLILNAGVYLSKKIMLDIKLERGSEIRYGDYLNQDNRQPLSAGYFSLQWSLQVEF